MLRYLSLVSFISLSGCSLLFSILSQPKDECQPNISPPSCVDESTSLICTATNELFEIDCGSNGCDEATGECKQFCGDNFIQRDNGEECDPPGETCNFACRLLPVCGDGVLNPADGPLTPAEQCDDGNNTNGDGCSDSCQIEFVAEIEPNDDGSPDQQDGLPVDAGNDFSAANAQGPFTDDVLLRGALRAAGDEDYFSIQNTSDQSRKVRVDTILELHKKCPLNPLILLVLDETGAPVSTAEHRDIFEDPCPGITIDLDPGELLHLLVMENSDRSFGDYLIFIDFDKGDIVCGDGFIDVNEECEGSLEFCSEACEYIDTCGDNFVSSTEGCDDGNRVDGDGCEANCSPTGAVIEAEPNELPTPQGPFTDDTLLFGRSNTLQDRDVFRIENNTNTTRTVRVDLFNPREGFGQACISPSLEIIALELLAENEALIERSFGQLTTSPDMLRGIDLMNRCGGFSIELAPTEARLIQVDLHDTSYLLNIDFTTCGDGEIEAGEECETPGSTGCDETCQRIALCGDGLLDFPEEQCEDGNTNNGDTCPSDCILVSGTIDEIEFNGDSLGIFGFHKQTFTDDTILLGTLQSFLERDLFQITNNNPTQATITVEVFSLIDGIGQPCRGLFTSMNSGSFPETSNGNCEGLLGQLTPGSSEFFSVDERGITTEAAYLLVIDFAACGNGEVDFNEECEPPGSATCDVSCQRIPLCGDGFLDLPESCDDGNIIDGDGCSSDCAPLDLVSENEPNEDGSPAAFTNDFSTANAEGPFNDSLLFFGELNPAGDEDVVELTNPTANALDLRLDVFDFALGLGVSCGAESSSIDPTLTIRGATGAIIAFNEDRSTQDFCPGLSFFLAPNQTVFAHIAHTQDEIPIDGYLLQVTFSPIVCGDGIVSAGESCDDGNTIDEDGCSSTCLAEDTGFDCPAGQTLLQVDSIDVPVSIPDNNPTGAESNITIADNRTIRRVMVGINSLTHTFVGDLRISLFSPANTEVSLLANQGNNNDGDNFINTIFDDACLAVGGPIADGVAPYIGCFSPDSPLAVLNNQSANGQWTLKIIDAAAQDVGALNSWSLGLCVQ
jgi:cysteine-rich repeat protein